MKTEKPKHNIGTALAPSAQKYATQDPYPQVPFAVEEERPTDWWAIGITVAAIAVGVILFASAR